MCKRRDGYGDWSRKTITITTKNTTGIINANNIDGLSLLLYYFVVVTMVEN
jgi:hypothetical protein